MKTVSFEYHEYDDARECREALDALRSISGLALTEDTKRGLAAAESLLERLRRAVEP